MSVCLSVCPQILILGLFLVPGWTLRVKACYEEHQLHRAASRKLSRHYPQPPEPLSEDPDSPARCPVELYQQKPGRDVSRRSVSPWRYVLVQKEDHFPSSYAEAQCLCSGCILIEKRHDSDSSKVKSIPVESYSYNSRPITQKRVFLKKELCNNEDGKKTYRLQPVIVEVAVGCTCVRALTSS
ncbi:hypothetical protein L3Q82_024313 [Scortum barcoo]|uniref:Uncharacterized protein n=1 Tax=Scortum barcoo TaxID=214431 RepID=A0ACB8WVD1_9TELE|nr:hypothetical protein L3Q82_024313 [Scortum barcoo]